MDETADFVTGGIVGLFAWFFGGLDDGYLNVLLTLIVINLILGSLEKFDIHELLRKIKKKITILCLVGVAHILDKQFLGDTSTLKLGVTLFYVTTEGIGLLKYAKELDIPIPKLLMSRLNNLQKQLNTEEDNKRLEKQVMDDYFDIREFINLEEAKDAAEIEQIDRIEKAEINKDFIESLTGVYSDDWSD